MSTDLLKSVRSPHLPHPLLVWPDLVGTTIESGQWWDQHIKPAIDAADPAGWAIDLGANIGWFSIYMSGKFEHVLAVEAHPVTFEGLQENLRVHGCGNVTAVHAAAYDRHAMLRMATGEEIGWSIPDYLDLRHAAVASAIAFIERPGETLDTNALPIDELVPDQARVTFVKCDVQGCDLRALRGLQKTIRRWRPPVVFEYEGISQHWHGDDFPAYEQFFAELGYDVAQIQEGVWDFLATPRSSRG